MAISTVYKETNIFKSAVLASIGAFFLALMALFAKLATSYTSDVMIVFFRFAVTGIYVLTAIQINRSRGNNITLKTNHFGMHFLRAIASTSAMYSLYYALRYIPLVDANLLTMTYPIFAMILASIFFKERSRLIVWGSVIVAFIGIIFVMKPSSGDLLHPAAFVGLFSGFSAAVAILGIRQLSKQEHTYTIMFYYTSFSLLISFLLVIFHWHTPDFHTLLLLLGVGIFGMLYQEFLTRALAYAPARIPSSLMYLSVIFSSIFGLLFWNQIPDYLSWLGIFLVSTGNIFVILYK